MIGPGGSGPEAGDPYAHPDRRAEVPPRRHVDPRVTATAFAGFMAGIVGALIVIAVATFVAAH